MSSQILHSPTYASLMNKHISQIISYLFEENKEFAIACNLNEIIFTPELPIEIQETFKESVLFIIANYSFESSKLEDEYFSFEAGFGSENFGSTVSMPLLAIKQIFVDEKVLMINYANTKDKIAKVKHTNNSMEALLNNPQNQKFRKKIKK